MPGIHTFPGKQHMPTNQTKTRRLTEETMVGGRRSLKCRSSQVDANVMACTAMGHPGVMRCRARACVSNGAAVSEACAEGEREKGLWAPEAQAPQLLRLPSRDPCLPCNALSALCTGSVTYATRSMRAWAHAPMCVLPQHLRAARPPARTCNAPAILPQHPRVAGPPALTCDALPGAGCGTVQKAAGVGSSQAPASWWWTRD